MEIDTERLWADLTSYFGSAELIAAWDEVREAPLTAWKSGKLKELVTEAVHVVERATKDLGPGLGPAKKQALIDWLDKIVMLPGILDNKPLDLDGRVISKLVDEAVEWWNRLLGHDWFKQAEVTP